MTWIDELKTIPLWKKYSQSNEEAYLDFILRHLPDNEKKLLVDLGAWDGYNLSNTRFFMEERGFDGLLVDGDNRGNNEVKQHFITQENILSIFNNYFVPQRFDLLCIDLDGNDIYILEQILRVYKPALIIAEFNPIFAKGESKAIRYNSAHTWNNDNYYGFSFAAGLKLAERFGYTCIFQNSNLNMYFVENNALAWSLKNEGAELNAITAPDYDVTNYHPIAQNTDWVDF